MRLLLVGVGGGLGSMLRYAIGLAAAGLGPGGFPMATLIVNVAGCTAIGVLSGLAQRPAGVSADSWALLVTGFLGGFTTFSAFGLETTLLLERERWLAAANIVLQLLLGIGGVFAGRALARVLAGAAS